MEAPLKVRGFTSAPGTSEKQASCSATPVFGAAGGFRRWPEKQSSGVGKGGFMPLVHGRDRRCRAAGTHFAWQSLEAEAHVPGPRPGKVRMIEVGRAMKHLLALWTSAVEGPFRGFSDWLSGLIKAAHYHPEKAYMRCRVDRGR